MGAPRDRKQSATHLHPAAGSAFSTADLMTAFVEALGVLFLDANLSVEIWHRDSEGQFTRARGILRRPDDITEFGSARLLSDTSRIDVRVADIPDPRPQEQILIGEETFLIQGEPRRDRERLIWTIELAPA